MKLVVDASPLIALAGIGRLELLRALFPEIMVPDAVLLEISKDDKPYSRELLRRFRKDKMSATNRVAVDFLQNDLGYGESEAIVLAIEHQAVLLVDDLKARRFAQSENISILGTIGVLLQGKKTGRIVSVRDDLDQLMSNDIRIGNDLYRHALSVAGEI
ncbi:hypothetical protein AU468_13595 [Alkalispirochaeta sphaeroplastigenens]|uniref:DUF3368 domain-containing protein n=1 Tax=Alkalispirochaeta sphaeroplastigenens TaxID=1187066 RepID=A0A2S4JFQ3_9SPIO|nr:DUF3368 domain-containing protein [Alkalispirochaeta sphaeroplastigenens]POQ98384.1 hypothetical protein AU468_13595 [Alkalispirochaeta sphaeroplastigenens]